jgi:hypothetical protein
MVSDLIISLTLGGPGLSRGYHLLGILENSGQSSLVSELGLVLVGKWQCWRGSPLAFLSSVADDPLVDIGGSSQPAEILDASSVILFNFSLAACCVVFCRVHYPTDPDTSTLMTLRHTAT